MYQRTETQGSLTLEKAIFLEDISLNMTSRDRKFKKIFNNPSKLNNFADTSTIGKLICIQLNKLFQLNLIKLYNIELFNFKLPENNTKCI